MYAIKKSLYLSVSAIILCGGSGNVFASGLPQTTHTRHISILSSAPSYQIASIQWLPDALEEGLKFSGFSSGGGGTDGGHGKGDGCDSKYNLSQCPDKGKCDRCAFASKYYLKGCDDGYKISGNSCVAKSCSALNTSYLSTIPANQICTRVTEDGLTCYKDCRNISCDGYKVNCTNGISATNVASSSLCPDCQSADANCTQKLCKITGCNSGYKVNSDGSACIELDDTCPSGYYKSCSDGTEGSPEYTEKGTACYKCKVIDTCPSGYYKSCSWGFSDGSPKYTEQGTACYKCCSSGYKYDSSNCPNETHSLCGSPCGGKYHTCSKRPYTVPSDSNGYLLNSEGTINYCGITFSYKRNGNDLSNCPNYETNSDFYTFFEEFNSQIYSVPYIRITRNDTPYAYACYNGDRACIDAYLKFQKNKEVTLDKDISCGVLGWYLKDSGTYTINGNGHTITFDKPGGNGFYLNSNENITLNVNNTKIIFKNSNCSDFISDVCYNWNSSSKIFFNTNRNSTVNLTNVDIDISGHTNAAIW